MSRPHVGRPLRRVEDGPLLVGAGLYTDDVRLPGTLHVAVLRSRHAHARLARLDVAAARGAPGVVTVVTGADVAHLGHPRPNRIVPSMKVPLPPLLARDVVRSIGEPVAAVAAETMSLARDAAERVEVEYEPLPPLAEAAAALAPGAPALFEALGDNLVLSHRWRAGDTQAAFAVAAHRVRVEVQQPRLSAMAMEPRGILAWHDAAAGELRLWASTQAPFRVRADVAACIGFPESRIRVVAPQVGGGFGVKGSPYVEPSALGWESGSVRVERTGAVTVVTGSSAHGQGHETTWAQIVADALGVAPEEIVVRHGDTSGAPQGFGTFGSRSTVLGGNAALKAATEVAEQGRRIAAALLEAAPADLVAADGGFHVTGSPTRRVTWRQVAEAAYGGSALRPGAPPGLEATVFFEGGGEAWSFGSVVAVIRIDADTGHVSLTRCVWVDDAGVVVNPLLAEGQLHGAYAQGAGQALLEALVYDEDGQLLTGSLMDYAVPRLGDFPEPVLAATVTPSPLNPLGAKGLGEAGCIALPPAIVSAVLDALAPLGVTDLDMPLTSEKIWRAMRQAP